MNVGCIIAGGVGKRFGASIPKQFIEVEGRPIIAHTMRRFEDAPDIDAYIVVCLESYLDEVQTYGNRYGFSKVIDVVAGGESFGESVRSGVYGLEPYCDDEDIFIMHMSIAPLVPDEILHDVVEVCRKCGNAFSAEPSYMCMCQLDGERSSATYLDREVLFGLNTPQAVRYGTIKDLYRRAEDDGYDLRERPHMSTLLFDYGVRVFFSESTPINIKITTQDDLKLLKAFLLMQRQDEEKGSAC